MQDCSAVILAGGKGTRSANPSIAKICQTINGKSLLEYHYQLLANSRIQSVQVVTGHLADQVQTLANIISSDKDVEIIQEDEQRGTVSAVQLAAQMSNSDRFLILLGDILCSFDVDKFIENWKASQKTVAVVAHPSLHPQDSDVAYPSHEGNVIVRSKGESKVGIPNMSSAGIFAMTREAISKYSSLQDIGSDVLSKASLDDDLFCWVDSHYFKDLGTPDRLNSGLEDVESGVFSRRGNLEPRPAVFLDRDGVLNPESPEIYLPEDFELLPDVAEQLALLNSSGIPVFIITNQPGIAKGFMSFETHQSIQAALDAQLSQQHAFCDEYMFCPHHPDSGFDGEVSSLKTVCTCRKPANGMILDIGHRHGIDLSKSVMVGDTWRDMEAAATSGMNFHHVSQGNCQISSVHLCFGTSADAISAAKRWILEC